MNKSFLKFVTDFGPLAIFFFYYYNSGKNLSVAIPPLIVATLVALAVVWFFEKKIPPMPLVSGILITFFGGLTIYFNDPIFIYVKPTIINILFALTLLFGKYFTKEPLIKKLIGKSITLTNEIWEILNRRWMFFFFGLALLNEFIWRTQTEEFWVNFKVWGMLPITIVFTAFQIPLLSNNKINFNSKEVLGYIFIGIGLLDFILGKFLNLNLTEFLGQASTYSPIFFIIIGSILLKLKEKKQSEK